MRERVYRNLQQKMLTLTLVASLAPLLILGMVLYYQFEQTGRDMTREQIRYRAQDQAEDVDLNDTISQTVSFLENQARINNIDILMDLDESMPLIASDQAKLQQVFLNLLTNAIDAIGSGGGTIEAASRSSDDKIVVTIKDDGPGLSDDMLRKVFDPFFTTKDPGKGTGLGLWVSYNIISKMGGRIHVKNGPDKGAVFSVQIPIVVPAEN